MSLKSYEEFESFYKNKLKQKLFEKFGNESFCIKKVNERFEQMLDYNVPHGKKLRGICAFESVVHLLDLNNPTDHYNIPSLLEQAKAIGWCIEFV